MSTEWVRKQGTQRNDVNYENDTPVQDHETL